MIKCVIKWQKGKPTSERVIIPTITFLDDKVVVWGKNTEVRGFTFTFLWWKWREEMHVYYWRFSHSQEQFRNRWRKVGTG